MFANTHLAVQRHSFPCLRLTLMRQIFPAMQIIDSFSNSRQDLDSPAARNLKAAACLIGNRQDCCLAQDVDGYENIVFFFFRHRCSSLVSLIRRQRDFRISSSAAACLGRLNLISTGIYCLKASRISATSMSQRLTCRMILCIRQDAAT